VPKEKYLKFKHSNLCIATKDSSAQTQNAPSLPDQSENLKGDTKETTVQAVNVKQQMVLLLQGNQCSGDSQQMILTDNGQNLYDSSGHTDTERTDGTV
jgi:Ni,Fe-hydrogenase I small subunit